MSKEEKNIYNVFVKMQSQEQCDRMKQLCIDNKIPFWRNFKGFELEKTIDNRQLLFSFSDPYQEFFVYYQSGLKYDSPKTEVTEEEFINLLK